MTEHPEPTLTREHLLACGAIIQMFARHERLLDLIMVTLVEGNSLVMVMTSGLSYRAKHDAVKAVLKAARSARQHVERINGFIGEIDQYSGLRNHMAHSIWTLGSRPGSVKPVSVTRGGKTKWLGFGPDERDYTLEQLNQIVDTLNERVGEFQRFLLEVGIILD
jgi:hypothetical protein